MTIAEACAEQANTWPDVAMTAVIMLGVAGFLWILARWL